MNYKNIFNEFIKTYDDFNAIMSIVMRRYDDIEPKLKSKELDNDEQLFLNSLHNFLDKLKDNIVSAYLNDAPNLPPEVLTAITIFVKDLSKKEMEIFMDMGIHNLSANDIANKRGNSKRTIETHLQRMMEKLEDNKILSDIFLKYGDNTCSYSPLKNLSKLFCSIKMSSLHN